ncbi:MAG: hypothetical protein LC624_10105 [Halobacteriales archaeon]|nr:hypothetical protein [Halobacteriales archaeon]
MQHRTRIAQARVATRGGRNAQGMLALRRAWHRGDEAASSVVAFGVAIVVYAVAFAAFLSFGNAPALVDDPVPALAAVARGAADSLLASPGASVGGTWVSDPDHMTRFGLAAAGKPGTLDLDKLRNLTRGELGLNATNNLLDYAEAKSALGAGVQDFHLRTFPLLPKLDDVPLQPITGVRVAYVGDWGMVQQNGSSSYLVQYSTSVQDVGGIVYVNVTIVNNGTTDSVFQTTYNVPLQHSVVDTQNTGLLTAGGGTQTLSLKLYKTSTFWKNAGSDRNVTLNIKDGTKSVANFKIDLGGINMTAGNAAYAMALVSPEKLTYKTNQYPKIDFNIYNGEGTQQTGVNIRSNFSYASNGTLIAFDQENTKSDSSNKWDAPKSAEGTYLMTVNTTGNYSFNSQDRIYVTDGDGGTFTPGPVYSYVESAASIAERRMLGDLVAGFKNTTYNNTGGDVYMDFSSALNNDFADNISADGLLKNYTAIVVGSNVDQNAMNSGAAMSIIRNYTLAGGLLVVLGSQSQQVGWLQQLFDASITTPGNGLGAPDPTNPILHVPEELGYTTYPDNGLTWSFGSADDASHFTHVINRGSVASTLDQVALSKPGHYGNGTIVLTGWQPYNLTAPQSEREAERVLYNFLMQVRGSLYVDFGPQLPTYQPVASTSRIATAADPLAPGQTIMVRVVLYAFP